MDKKQREARRHQEDQALNRGLIWVGGAIVLEFLLLLINRYSINFMVSEAMTASAIRSSLAVLRILAGAAGVALLLWSGLRFRKGEKAGLQMALALACGAVAICAHVVVAFQKNGIQMLFLMVPAWAGLALVYYLYQREFFLAAIAVGTATLGLWFVRFGGIGLEAVLSLIVVLAATAVVLWLKKQGGVVRRGEGKTVRLLPEKTGYPIVLTSCLVGLAALVAAMVLGANAAYYLMFVMVAWLFVLLVYYTVKMM